MVASASLPVRFVSEAMLSEKEILEAMLFIIPPRR